ncbi:hypothetical protein LJC72_11715, partial [Bacteroides sp. OttesenSCG-928-D19]|nr:hypothetical protein [Bacteroides sp. OttesenSCG-928-D19]
GHSYYFHLGINSDMGLEVSSVSEWVGMDVEPTEGQADEGVLYKIGDYYPDPADPTTAIGVVFWVNPNNNRHGKIVSLDEGSNAWGPSSSTTNATSLYNGMANMNTVYTRYPGYANYPAFAWVHAKNGGGLTNYYTEVTTGVWYLPAVEEMRMLTVGYCGKAYEDVANWAADIGMPDWSDTECANARSAFDNKLKAAGGSVLNSDNKYWTSTESDFFDAFRCTTEGTYANVPKSNSYSIRAFYSF